MDIIGYTHTMKLIKKRAPKEIYDYTHEWNFIRKKRLKYFLKEWEK